MKQITHVFAIAAAAVWGFILTPAGQAVLQQYPHLASAIAGLTTIAALYHNPKAAAKIVVIALLLFAVAPIHAQTTAPATPPAVHFVLSGSASGFSTAGGASPASILGAAVNLTPHFSAGYVQITIPSISGRFQLGVVNYTRTLHDLLGAKISSSFAFDLSNVNITFQAGAGKLLEPTVNRIAETVGGCASYPVTNNVAIELACVHVLHGGLVKNSVNGFLTTNTSTAVGTGLVFYF